METVLESLLSWGFDSVKHSVNQPVLPHVIIAINMVPNDISENEWDSDYATKWLLANVNQSLSSNVKFRKFMPKVGTDQEITAELLLRQYYSSVSVIKIPSCQNQMGRYNQMKHQIHCLYDTIKRACYESRDMKDQYRVLLTADQISPYIRLAYTHFTSEYGLTEPFDFVKASFKFNPVSADFPTHLLELARLLLDNCINTRSRVVCLENEFSKAVASCIMLDAIRNKRTGDSQTILRSYIAFCTETFQSIRDLWPCDYPGCVNVATRHAKGHQSKAGLALRTSEDSMNYFLSVDLENVESNFIKDVGQTLDQLLDRLPKRSDGVVSYEVAARRSHRRAMREFYKRNGGPSRFISHRTCFSCLTGIAEHPIRCNHIICTKCIREMAGSSKNEIMMELEECPLHDGSIPTEAFLFQPPQAGVRILTLDG